MAPSSWTKVIIFLCALVALATLAFKLGENLFDGRDVREPAALRRTLVDYSNLPATTFAIKAREHLRDTVKLERKANSLFISLGHFLGPNQPVSACNTFREVQYELTAEGIASHGEPPIMQIASPCEPSSDSDGLEPIEIDIRELVNLKPVDQTYNYSRRVRIETHNFSDIWPNEWVLTKVQLIGSDKKIELTTEDLRQLSLPTRSVSW